MSKPKLKTITYLGPKDPRDVVTVYRLPADSPDGEDLVLTKGIPGEATAKQVERLQDDEEHRFTLGEAPEAGDSEGAPWTDYAELSAEQVVERIGDPGLTPTAEVAQAVVDWEKDHEKRKTVIDAATHQAAAYNPQGEGGE